MKKALQQVRLVHNPTAGDEEHSKKQLLELIQSKGYRCNYDSSKEKPLRAVSPSEEIIAVAGGDGTIRKTMLQLLDKKLKSRRPLAILPLGTANNIAGSLGIGKNHAGYISSWSRAEKKPLDAAYVRLGKTEHYFVESFGLGVFPRLMKEMDKVENPPQGPKLEMELALSKLAELARTIAPFTCRILASGRQIQGSFLMVEVMNIPRLGPQLNFAPQADPGDGFLDLVLVGQEQREELASYISKLASGKNASFPFRTQRVKSAELSWETRDARIDDELLKSKKKKGSASISVLPALLSVISGDG